MSTQEIQQAFDSLLEWEKEIFLTNNSEQLVEDMTVPRERPNLDEVETEDIAAWLVENDLVTCGELLDAVVDDVEELREIMVESAVDENESQGGIIDEEELYGPPPSSDYYEPDEDFPY